MNHLNFIRSRVGRIEMYSWVGKFGERFLKLLIKNIMSLSSKCIMSGSIFRVMSPVF